MDDGGTRTHERATSRFGLGSAATPAVDGEAVGGMAPVRLEPVELSGKE